MKRFRLLLTLLLLVLAGCASVPMASQDQDRASKQFAQSREKAGIYLFRKSKFSGSAVVLPVSIDAKVVGGTKAGTYFFWGVTPGTYTISSQNLSSMPSIDLSVEAGKSYFIEQNFHTWELTPTVTLDVVGEAEGKAQVIKCQLLSSSFKQ